MGLRPDYMRRSELCDDDQAQLLRGVYNFNNNNIHNYYNANQKDYKISYKEIQRARDLQLSCNGC